MRTFRRTVQIDQIIDVRHGHGRMRRISTATTGVPRTRPISTEDCPDTLIPFPAELLVEL